MVGRKHGDIPDPLLRGRERFESWRRSRKMGDRIPERLWSLAARLGGVHGVSRTACVLKLDYYSLRQRVASQDCESDSAAPSFIELSPSPATAPPQAPSTAECVVELEDGLGARMRVHLRGCELPDLADLCRSFRRRD
jgi:hypothetical protein